MDYTKLSQKDFFNELKKDFPKLCHRFDRFRDIECGTGWANLIYEFASKATLLQEDLCFLQVKEKFGGLRLYVGASKIEVFDLIREYEVLASHTCEYCGTTSNVGVANIGYWISTVCEPCFLDAVEKRKPEIHNWKKVN